MDLVAVASYCANCFSGPVAEPLGLQEWRHIDALFQTAFPDFCPNGRIDSVEGSMMHITDEATGTQTRDLDLRSLGMGINPATGKSVSLRQETGRVTFKGDKVVNLHFDDTPVGGLEGILARLGAEASQPTPAKGCDWEPQIPRVKAQGIQRGAGDDRVPDGTGRFSAKNRIRK
jgi:hypothetical protein